MYCRALDRSKVGRNQKVFNRIKALLFNYAEVGRYFGCLVDIVKLELAADANLAFWQYLVRNCLTRVAQTRCKMLTADWFNQMFLTHALVN